MKPLKFYPAKKKLTTARGGKAFRCGAGGGGVMHSVSEHEQDSVSVIIGDDESNKQSDDNITKEGDASIEIDDTAYEMWLAAEGLMKLKESKENIRKNNYNNEKSVKGKEKNTKWMIVVIKRKWMIVVIKRKWKIVVIKRKLMIVVIKRK